MSHRQGKWEAPPAVDLESRRLAAELGITPVLARLLKNRGCHTVEAAREFLGLNGYRPEDPGRLAGMAAAVAAVEDSLDEGKPILVYGDYDVDGISAAAIMCSFLRAAGAEVIGHIPSRLDEGYGLNSAALTRAAADGFGLVVTVDCGITALEEAALARSLGLTLVITDHHEPHAGLPDAAAVVNPRRADCPYPNKGLAGAGVAFKLAQALAVSFESSGRPAPSGGWSEYALSFGDLAALGSVADAVPLLGENRALVRHGLELINRHPRPGIRALLEAAGFTGEQVSEYHVGYLLAPRLNACGRMGRLPSDTGLSLLMEQDPETAAALARSLEGENRHRQEEESAVLAAALGQLEERGLDDCFLVADSEDWHPGVLGIVAARLADRFGRPAAVISWQNGGEGRGSARGPDGFDLMAVFETCKDLLVKYGGHTGAAGLTADRSRFGELKRRLNSFSAAGLEGTADFSRENPEVELDPGEVTLEMAEDLALLAPFGPGNPPPRCLTRGSRVIKSRRIGRNLDHLSLHLGDAGRGEIQGVVFKCRLESDPVPGEIVDIVYNLEVDTWRKRRRAKAMIRDLADGDLEALRRELSANSLPREILARIYRRLREHSEDGKTIVEGEAPRILGLPGPTVLTALGIFHELGLIQPEGTGWRFVENPPRTSLEKSREYVKRTRRLEELNSPEPYPTKIKIF